jgi:uncharacterized protein
VVEPPSPVAGSVRLGLWLVRWVPLVPAADLDPVLRAHLEYVVGLERRGLVFASGPVTDPDGTFRGEGLTVLRAGSADQARALAGADPFVLAGLRDYTVARWTVIEGAFAVTLRFSDSSFTVEGN